MSYKLIALDMDGTLFNDKKEVSLRNRQAIKEARASGKTVVIATGRPLIGIQGILEELELNTEADYVVSFNGALVQNVKTGEVIFQSTLEHEDYRSLYELSQTYGVHIHALTREYVTTPKLNPYTKVEADANVIRTIQCDVDKLPESETIIKVMFVDDSEKLDAIEQMIPPEIRAKYTVVRSSDIFLEFLPPTVNKGVGVSAIAKVKDILAHEVICVGDAGNDIAMLEYAGLGVAMGNAFDEVKKIANHVTDTNEEDGVAKVIEQFMLKKMI
ncbi:sugar-phosphatase [Fusibacter ferrireducens]|uniref:Sugar-phosphatase n=1 Tax=Fusibacter ferrireducens TaxID=2785058 RepID=A0ABR9ZMA0_9FIRM|nr:sugar-phosphatase [Fusibacter ferrireducens]MBF4691559.1 sugar-phosphatase [Fusibacter ferrireducens]